jgi:hypothetical protein
MDAGVDVGVGQWLILQRRWSSRLRGCYKLFKWLAPFGFGQSVRGPSRLSCHDNDQARSIWQAWITFQSNLTLSD